MRNVFLALILILAAGAAPSGQTMAVTTVVIVRHAEAVPNSGSDAVLSEAGIARATALGEALKDAEVAAVMTTQYQRTILTGQPIATSMKAELIKGTIEGGAAGLDTYVRQIVQTVHAKYAGKTVLIVGHSNTVPALVKGFSGVDVGEIAHDSYDQMFVVTTASPKWGRVVRARYGK